MECTRAYQGAEMLTADFLSNHRFAVEVICGISLWVSLSLILRMWLLHRQNRPIKKVFWSMLPLIPFAGWVAYGACGIKRAQLRKILSNLSTRAAAPTPTSRFLTRSHPTGDKEADRQHDEAKGDGGLCVLVH